MTATPELLEAYEAMASLLDTKLANMPEWKIFRALHRAVTADQTSASKGAAKDRAWPNRPGQPPSYTALTDMALKERAKPIPTPILMDFIRKHREVDPDPDRAKINVTSSLSKSPLFQSIAWEGGKAWWYTNQPVPK